MSIEISPCETGRSRFRSYRIYFREADKNGTCWWGIDEGHTSGEIRVKGFNVHSEWVASGSSYGPQPPRSDPWQEEYDAPESWICCSGFATFENGMVNISATENQ